jgi:hypothetical protein
MSLLTWLLFEARETTNYYRLLEALELANSLPSITVVTFLEGPPFFSLR